MPNESNTDARCALGSSDLYISYASYSIRYLLIIWVTFFFFFFFFLSIRRINVELPKDTSKDEKNRRRTEFVTFSYLVCHVSIILSLLPSSSVQNQDVC